MQINLQIAFVLDDLNHDLIDRLTILKEFLTTTGGGGK